MKKYSNEEIEIANKTFRHTGAVGKNAITPRIIEQLFSPEDNLSILDYGAGTIAAHAVYLRTKGYRVTAHEFGNNINSLHDEFALDKKYDIIYASNVMNVLSSEKMIKNVLQEFKASMKETGVTIVNYPTSPRKLNLSTGEMRKTIESVFNVRKINNSTVVWKLKFKKE